MAKPASDDSLLMLMIEPPLFCAMNWRAAALEQKKTPSRFTATMAFRALGENAPHEILRFAQDDTPFCNLKLFSL